MRKPKISDNIIKGNEQIHIYMGWEYITPEEVMNYSFSPSSLSRKSYSPIEYVKRDNLPKMKRKGVVISTISHDDVYYSELLDYHRSLDSMYPVLEKLSKEYYGNNDPLVTIQNLLHGNGEKMVLTKENLWNRLVKLVSIINER